MFQNRQELQRSGARGGQHGTADLARQVEATAVQLVRGVGGQPTFYQLRELTDIQTTLAQPLQSHSTDLTKVY